MTTRSAVLGARRVPAAVATPVFTCPASTTAIVKSITIYNPGPDVTGVYPGVHRVNPPVDVALPRPGGDPGVSTYTELWMVMEPSDHLDVYSTATEVDVWVSGALLPLRPA